MLSFRTSFSLPLGRERLPSRYPRKLEKKEKDLARRSEVPPRISCFPKNPNVPSYFQNYTSRGRRRKPTNHRHTPGTHVPLNNTRRKRKELRERRRSAQLAQNTPHLYSFDDCASTWLQRWHITSWQRWDMRQVPQTDIATWRNLLQQWAA